MTRSKLLWLPLGSIVLAWGGWLARAVAEDAPKEAPKDAPRDAPRDARREGRGQAGRRGEGPGAFDPAEMQRMMEEMRQRESERMRDELGATAEEWKVLEAKIQAVQTARMNLFANSVMGRGFGGGGRGGFGPGGFGQGGGGPGGGVPGGAGGFGPGGAGPEGPGGAGPEGVGPGGAGPEGAGPGGEPPGGRGADRARGRGGDRRQGGMPDPSAMGDVAKAQAALGQVLAKEKPEAAEVDGALKALRAARAKAQADLAKAQKELQELLTKRQEAILVLRGILD